MPGTTIGAWNKPLEVLRRTATPAANQTNLSMVASGGCPCLGYGTCRVFVFSDQAVTITFAQKPAGSAYTLRQTDSQAVAASTGTSIEFLITGDLCDVRVTTTTAPTTFECEVSLHP